MRHVQVILEDDVTGERADETVRFGLDGKSYEIDLSSGNARQLREQLAQYIRAGRRQTGRRAKAPSAHRVRPSVDSAAVRIWGRAHGYTVSDHGRPSQEVIDAFLAAGN